MDKCKDKYGVEYQVGDIILNSGGIGDYWVVQTCSEEEKERYGLTTDLCFALNNDKNDYVIDIDEPVGFIVVMRPDDEHYQEAIDELNKRANIRRRDYDGEDEINKENK